MEIHAVQILLNKQHSSNITSASQTAKVYNMRTRGSQFGIYDQACIGGAGNAVWQLHSGLEDVIYDEMRRMETF